MRKIFKDGICFKTEIGNFTLNPTKENIIGPVASPSKIQEIPLKCKWNKRRLNELCRLAYRNYYWECRAKEILEDMKIRTALRKFGIKW